MRKYLLPENGKFYKANLHCHTTVSDGRLTPEEVKEAYMAEGYSVIAYTDHDVMIPHPELCDDKFLALNGYEMEVNQAETLPYGRKTCHMCLIAKEPDNLRQVCYHREKYLFGNAKGYADKVNFDESEPDYVREYTHERISDMMQRGRDAGFFVTYNHPNWSMEESRDFCGYNGMHAMEIVNYGCVAEGWDDRNEAEYDSMLREGKRIFAVATDDNHNHRSLESPIGRDSFGGYVMIKAPELEYRAITTALENGDFYASEGGPNITALWFEDGKMHVECDGARRIVFSCGARRCRWAGKDGELTYSAEYEVRPEDYYVRIRLEDNYGRCTYTSAYFTDELLGE